MVVEGQADRGLFTAERPSDLGRGWSILQKQAHAETLLKDTNKIKNKSLKKEITIYFQVNILYIRIVCLTILNNIPVDLHANRLRSGRRVRGLHDFLNKLMCHFPLRQENICLVSRHTLLQANQVKYGQVTAL